MQANEKTAPEENKMLVPPSINILAGLMSDFESLQHQYDIVR